MIRLVFFAWLIVKWIKKSHRPIHFLNKMLYEKCDCKSRHVVLLCMLYMRNESHIFFLIFFILGVLRGCFGLSLGC